MPQCHLQRPYLVYKSGMQRSIEDTPLILVKVTLPSRHQYQGKGLGPNSYALTPTAGAEVILSKHRGKKGQFPLGFGKRGGVRGTAANTQQGGFKTGTTINNTVTNKEAKEPIFALMTTTNELKILTTLPPNANMFPNKNSTYSYQPTVE